MTAHLMIPSAPTGRLGRLTLALSLAASLLPAGCARRSDEGVVAAAEGPRRGGTLVMGWTNEPANINELIAAPSAITDEFTHLVFLHLLQEQADYEHHPPTFRPELATSYAWSPDHRTLTFHLRDAMWSDGVPVTAEDVRWTWIAQTRPEVAWTSAFMKQRIDDVAVVDPHTVRFHFTRAYAKQLLDVNEGAIYPKHAWEKLPFARWRQAGDWFNRNAVVDGPYTVASWETQQEIDLRANPRYFEPGRPYIDRVIWRVIPNQNSQITQLLSGEIDAAMSITPRDATRVQGDPRLSLYRSWFRSWVGVAWNAANPLFADPELRRALTLAIDRDTIVKTLWGPYARIADSPIVHTVWAHDPALQPWPFQPEEARRILAHRGFRPNRDGVLERAGKPFSFELSTNAGNQQRADAAVMIQEQLRRIGVEAKVRQLEFNTLSSALDHGRYDATIIGFTMDTSLDLTAQFHSGSPENITHYSNPTVDRLIDTAMGRQDIAQSTADLRRMQELLHRDEPYTLLWESQRLNGVKQRVRGVQSNALFSLFNLHEWWLAPADR